MWVLYIPRDRKSAGGLLNNAQQWQRSRPDKIIHIVTKGETLPEDGLLGERDSLYIMGGHGLSGSPAVTWPDNYKNPINSDEIGRCLLASGFNRASTCRIKVYSCFSAHPESGHAMSMATRFAGKMRDLGFRTCRYFGYSTEVSQRYVDTGAFPGNRQVPIHHRDTGLHKFARGSVLYTHRAGSRRVAIQ